MPDFSRVIHVLNKYPIGDQTRAIVKTLTLISQRDVKLLDVFVWQMLNQSPYWSKVLYELQQTAPLKHDSPMHWHARIEKWLT